MHNDQTSAHTSSFNPRREFLKACVLGGGSACALEAQAFGAPPRDGNSRYLLADRATASPVSLPTNKRLAFGWSALAVPPEGEAHLVALHWPPRLPVNGAARLRVTVALDEREEKRIEVRLLRSGRVLGEFDIRFAVVFQPFELRLNAADARAAAREGVALRMTRGSKPLWLFSGGAPSMDDALRPHLLLAGTATPREEFHRRFASLASVQLFGWMEGCVLDGLYDLSRSRPQSNARAALNQHLNLFFADGQLRYEDGFSVPADNRIYGIEGTLPFAALAKTMPDHPMIAKVIEFWQQRQDDEGCVIDRQLTSAEGSYTVAYPMAVIAAQRKDAALAQLALKQLRLRRQRLVVGEDLYQRTNAANGPMQRNWARGIAWYLLGLTRTLIALKEQPNLADLRQECRRVAAWVRARQQPDGLWTCFIDQAETGVDTSGSAGIAAALALGANHGLLAVDARRSAVKAFAGLQRFLTPDGFLTGVAQANKGGEALQRNGYRVIYQMAMGLMAQLEAALDEQRRRA